MEQLIYSTGTRSSAVTLVVKQRKEKHQRILDLGSCEEGINVMLTGKYLLKDPAHHATSLFCSAQQRR